MNRFSSRIGKRVHSDNTVKPKIICSSLNAIFTSVETKGDMESDFENVTNVQCTNFFCSNQFT